MSLKVVCVCVLNSLCTLVVFNAKKCNTITYQSWIVGEVYSVKHEYFCLLRAPYVHFHNCLLLPSYKYHYCNIGETSLSWLLLRFIYFIVGQVDRLLFIVVVACIRRSYTMRASSQRGDFQVNHSSIPKALILKNMMPSEIGT